MKMKIFLVEDDDTMGILLVDFLESNGFDVYLYKNGIDAWEAFSNYEFSFCILDVMLPGLDGFSLATKIRGKNKKIPIVFLTAKVRKSDKLKGFDIGIDDYIIKPFDEDELLCRINSILNRCQQSVDLVAETISIGTFDFQHKNLCLSKGGCQKRLTQKESDVLQALAVQKNSLVKREDILLKVWGNSDYFNGRSLDVFIAKLRKYLNEDPNVSIENVPKVGFILKDV